MHPLLHLVIQLLPLDALHLIDTEPLHTEHGETLIKQVTADGAVHLRELTAIPCVHHPVSNGAYLIDGLRAHEIEHLVLEGVVPCDAGAAGSIRPSAAVLAVWGGGIELGGGVEVVHGAEGEAAERAVEAAGVERHRVAEHEVAELVLEARHGELHGDPSAAGDGGGGEVVDGDVDGGEVVRGVVLGSLEDERLRGGVPEVDELLGGVEIRERGGGGGGVGGGFLLTTGGLWLWVGGGGGGRGREEVRGDGGEAVVEAGEDADHVVGGVLGRGERLDDVLRRRQDLVVADDGGGHGDGKLAALPRFPPLRRGRRRGRHRLRRRQAS